MKPTRRILIPALAAAYAAFVAGCASKPMPEPEPATEVAPQEGFLATGREVASQDLVAAADRISRGIAGVPGIANAKSTPRIVMAPVTKDTRALIDADLFLSRMRILLNESSMNKARFLDRAMMARIAPHQADYLMASRLEDAADRGDYVIYRFRLSDARTGALLWQDGCEIKRDSLDSE